MEDLPHVIVDFRFPIVRALAPVVLAAGPSLMPPFAVTATPVPLVAPDSADVEVAGLQVPGRP